MLLIIITSVFQIAEDDCDESITVDKTITNEDNELITFPDEQRTDDKDKNDDEDSAQNDSKNSSGVVVSEKNNNDDDECSQITMIEL